MPGGERVLIALLLAASMATDGHAADRGDEGQNDHGSLLHLFGSTGQALLQQGRASDAERAFQAVVRLDPARWTGRYALGMAMMDQCRFAHAASQFSAASSAIEQTRRECQFPDSLIICNRVKTHSESRNASTQ